MVVVINTDVSSSLSNPPRPPFVIGVAQALPSTVGLCLLVFLHVMSDGVKPDGR